MKHCAAILLLAVATTVLASDGGAGDWSVQHNDDLVKYRTQCITKYDIGDEQLNKFKAWQFEDAELTHNYIHCVFGKLGLYADETGFNKERIYQQLTHNGGGADETELRKKIDDCAAEAAGYEGTYAFKAYKGLKCFSKFAQLIKDSIKKH